LSFRRKEDVRVLPQAASPHATELPRHPLKTIQRDHLPSSPTTFGASRQQSNTRTNAGLAYARLAAQALRERLAPTQLVEIAPPNAAKDWNDWARAAR